jgi:7-cyano-7-deazaguanine synthase
MSSKAIVVFSGGQDSTTCLFWAKQRFDEVQAICFAYGQRHKTEILSAKKICDMAEVDLEIVDLTGDLVSASPLLNHEKEPETYLNFLDMENKTGKTVANTFVPLRNLFFLTIAANRAVASGCKSIVTGICGTDNANYPDCTEVFRQNAQLVINTALPPGQHIFIEAPLIKLTKKETVLLARTLPGCWEALSFSHTSYDGKYPPIDNNHSNLLRAKGFEDAGFPDPLVMRAVHEGSMECPETSNYDSFRRMLASEHASRIAEELAAGLAEEIIILIQPKEKKE